MDNKSFNIFKEKALETFDCHSSLKYHKNYFVKFNLMEKIDRKRNKTVLNQLNFLESNAYFLMVLKFP